MKKSNVLWTVAFLVLTISLICAVPESGAKAAGPANVLDAPEAEAGEWVAAAKGYRYRYAADGSYAKNAWLKIGGNIYFFKSDGYLKTGWKKYNGRRYWFDGQGVLFYGGWKTIGGAKYYLSGTTGGAFLGKKKIAGSYYFFHKTTGKMLTGWREINGVYYYFDKTSGKMAISRKVGRYYVDANGRRVASLEISEPPAEGTQKKEVIFVGDSRTAGMCASVHSNCTQCIKEVGKGYAWLISDALPRLQAKLNQNPNAAVIFNLGVNDIDQYPRYIAKYKQLIKAYPKTDFYFLSVNPIDKKYDAYGYFGGYSRMYSWVKTFNQQMKKAFPDKFINSYTYLNKNGFSTTDGLHYTAETYKKIYDFVMGNI